MTPSCLCRIGCEYDLLSRNCNNFCQEFAEKLGVSSIPGDC